MGRKWSWKWGLGVLASFLFALWHDAVAEIDFLCPLCGEGKEMTIPNGIVTIPQNPSFGCAELDGLAAQGSIDQQTCGVLETFAQEPCGCEASLDGNATAAPVGTPITVPPSPSTVGPTFGSEPECYDDLDNIRQRELALSSDALAVGRTYVLCPGAVFLMGRAIPGGFEGGFEAITPRPNVHYKCGAYGSSADSCRLLYGDYAIISAGGGDPQHTNVTFEGLTIESSVTAGVVAVMPGDLTFVDCIFKNHKNSGPVSILFNSPVSRRLLMLDLHMRQQYGIHSDTGDLYEGFNSGYSDEERVDARHLQGSKELTTLTLTFTRCLFVGNKLDASSNPGMVNSVTPETTLIFDDVTFYNNDYGDDTLKNSMAAIFSSGPLTVRNTCFVQNSFSRDAPIISIGGSHLDISSTYIDVVDNELRCSVAASYNNQSDWATGGVGTCADLDPAETECQSSVDLNPVTPSPGKPQGTLSPSSMTTRAPVKGVDNEGVSVSGSPSSLRSLVGVTTVAAMLVLL